MYRSYTALERPEVSKTGYEVLMYSSGQHEHLKQVASAITSQA